MRIGGITAEFNPFHNGHEALCLAARAAGMTHLVAVMSGNFVQRGDFAFAEKRVRTACALEAGVDLVLELPVAWACSTAQVFARGAVSLLAACACVDTLCFGSECAEADTLRTLAAAVEDAGVQAGLRAYLSGGMTYAKARELAVRDKFGETLSARLSSPNDLLGVEYLRRANELGWNPGVFVLKRKGVQHDAGLPSGGFASASWLRANAENLSDISAYMPGPCFERLSAACAQGLLPARKDKLEAAVLAKLRMMERSGLASLPDLSEGLENRLYSAIRRSRDAGELEAALKTKRYTLARVRRLILSAFLGIRREDAAGAPPYLRVLGFNRRGRDILRRMDGAAALPADTSLARLSRRGERCAATAGLEQRCTDIYTLALPRALPCGYDFTAGAVIM